MKYRTFLKLFICILTSVISISGNIVHAERIVQIPNFGPVSFPDGTPEEEIQQRVAKFVASRTYTPDYREQGLGALAESGFKRTSAQPGNENPKAYPSYRYVRGFGDFSGFLAERFGESVPLTLIFFIFFYLFSFIKKLFPIHSSQSLLIWPTTALVIVESFFSYFIIGHTTIDSLSIAIISAISFILLQLILKLASKKYLIQKNNYIQSSPKSVSDDLWEKAMIEIKSGNMQLATWARSIEEANGEEAKAQSIYLRRRVIQLSKYTDTAIKTPSNSPLE